MKYEDVFWHNGAHGYSKGLVGETAGTPTGMFLAWALLGGLGSTLHAGGLARLRSREITPGAFFYDECDGKLTDEDLSEEATDSPRPISIRKAAATCATMTRCYATACRPPTTCATPGRTSTS